MKKIIWVVVVLIIIVLVGFYFVSKNSPTVDLNKNTIPNSIQDNNVTNSIPDTNITNNKEKPAASEVSIDIKNFAFNPNTLTIKAGTKVTWTNNDSAPHTVTSDLGNLLDSPTLSPGESFSFVFNNTGSTKYHCAIHKMMKGEIVIN